MTFYIIHKHPSINLYPLLKQITKCLESKITKKKNSQGKIYPEEIDSDLTRILLYFIVYYKTLIILVQYTRHRHILISIKSKSSVLLVPL